MATPRNRARPVYASRGRPVYASLSAPAPGPPSPLGPVRKALPPLAAFIGQLVALNVLHGTALEVASAVLAGLALLGVYLVPPNTPAAPDPEVDPGWPVDEPYVGDAPTAPTWAPAARYDQPVVSAPPVQHRPPRGR